MRRTSRATCASRSTRSTARGGGGARSTTRSRARSARAKTDRPHEADGRSRLALAPGLLDGFTGPDPDGDRRRLDPAVHAELVEDMGDVDAGRLRTDEQRLG